MFFFVCVSGYVRAPYCENSLVLLMNSLSGTNSSFSGHKPLICLVHSTMREKGLTQAEPDSPSHWNLSFPGSEAEYGYQTNIQTGIIYHTTNSYFSHNQHPASHL